MKRIRTDQELQAYQPFTFLAMLVTGWAILLYTAFREITWFLHEKVLRWLYFSDSIEARALSLTDVYHNGGSWWSFAWHHPRWIPSLFLTQIYLESQNELQFMGHTIPSLLAAYVNQTAQGNDVWYCLRRGVDWTALSDPERTEPIRVETKPVHLFVVQHGQGPDNIDTFLKKYHPLVIVFPLGGWFRRKRPQLLRMAQVRGLHKGGSLSIEGTTTLVLTPYFLHHRAREIIPQSFRLVADQGTCLETSFEFTFVTLLRFCNEMDVGNLWMARLMDRIFEILDAAERDRAKTIRELRKEKEELYRGLIQEREQHRQSLQILLRRVCNPQLLKQTQGAKSLAQYLRDLLAQLPSFQHANVMPAVAAPGAPVQTSLPDPEATPPA